VEAFDSFVITPFVALDADNCVIPVRLLASVPAVAHEPALDEDTEIACWRISSRPMPSPQDIIADCRSEAMARLVVHALARCN